MHDPTCEGNEFFKCDFCRKPWAEDRPMVEGHQGSLICAHCLTACYTEVIVLSGGAELSGAKCTMCLEHRSDPQWASPIFPESLICRRCIRQGAVTLERDEEHAWKRPTGGTAKPGDDPDDD